MRDAPCLSVPKLSWNAGLNTYLLSMFPGITLDVPKLTFELLEEVNSWNQHLEAHHAFIHL